jgi:hypothetical protein
LVKKKIDEISSKPMPKKLTRKQAVQEQYEDEDEEEEVIVKPKRAPRTRQAVQHQEPSYSNLVKQTAADQIRQRLENEHIKMAMLSIMPSYKF